MNDETNKILMDMSERLVRLETKIDAMSDTRDIANKALSIAENSEERIEKIENTISWAGRIVIGLVITALVGLVIVSGGGK